MAGPHPTYRERFAQSQDGTRIGYRVYGDGPHWLVIANGLGASYEVWDELFELLAPHTQVLIWHYRGQYSSSRPADPSATSMADHCADLDVLLEQEGIKRYVLAGWSIGVQVALAQYRRSSSRIDGLMLINGAHDRLLENLFGLDAPKAISRIARLLRTPLHYLAPRLEPLVHRLLDLPTTAPLFEKLGMVRGGQAAFVRMAHEYAGLDFDILLRWLVNAQHHRTAEWLHCIRAPTLVTVGLHDRLTPPEGGLALKNRIPDVVWRPLPESAHFPMLEETAALAEAMLEHLDRVYGRHTLAGVGPFEGEVG